MQIDTTAIITPRRRFTGTLLAAAVMFSFASAQASGPATGSAGARPATPQQDAKATERGRSVTEQDRELIEDLAHANLAEIETGRLAMEKSASPQVRQFAQRMIDDHTAAQRELEQLAKRKTVEVPKETDFQHKAIATALRILDGKMFDERYLRHVGVNDHRRTVDLLEKTQRSARDADLQAYARKTLATVQQHLAMARQMSGANAAAAGSSDSRSMGAASGQQQQRQQQPSSR